MTSFTKLLRNLAILASLAVLPGTLFAQVYKPPTQGGGQPAGGGGNGGTNTTIVNRQPAQQNRQVAGNDMPWLDPSNNVFMFDGKQFNVQDNQVFRSRFEKYLNAAEANSEIDLAYRKSIRAVLDALSPHKTPDLATAVANLQYAAEFPQDARLSESLANAIYRVWLAKKSGIELQQLNKELDDRRRQLDWNFDAWKEPNKLTTTPRSTGRQGQQQQQQQQTAQVTNPANAGHVSRYVQRIAEVEAERVANKAKMALTEVEAKLEFQGLIVQFFLQRRFEHVIMAARLYTEFFQDGSGRLQFEEGSDVEKGFAKSIGFNPTIATLDSFANEAIRDVDQAVESFGFLLQQTEIDGATRQLQQAFVLGEYLPSVQNVPRDSKRKVLEYAQNGFQLVNAMEVKDYTLAEELVTKMRQQARDFDHSKPTAAIEGAKLASTMRIRTAKNAALKGDDAAYEENIKAAAELWPTNPELKAQFTLIADAGDIQEQAKIEFDRLLSTQSYRQIFDNKARFTAATVDDGDRQKALEEIVNNILEIETAMKQADGFAKAGNPHMAWELIEVTFRKFPDDVPLSALRSELSTEVAEFVKALKTADNLEKRDQTGSALSWYLKSKRMYPQSQYAQEGIDRLVGRILPDEAGGGGSIGSPAEATPSSPHTNSGPGNGGDSFFGSALSGANGSN
ncbi:MAG: hypothetical protein KDM64_03860 [Verrucomicrobiae bacterium]|nr:hypothetical protein [Verrucomicrobiae bacterium]